MTRSGNRLEAKQEFKPDFPAEIVKEGNVRLLVPRLTAFATSPSEYAPSKAPVFYNPVMELNRDIAVLILQAYQKTVSREVTICEPLAGCGAMGIRFAAEVAGVKAVTMADINERSAKLADHNIKLNSLDEKVTAKREEANFLMSGCGAPQKRFDVINIDPFGSPVPYLGSAIRALRNNGLLAVTATDMAPLCGVHTKACLRKYGGKPLRTEYCHELAIRLLAGCIAATAAKLDIGVNIIFSHCTDHYIRVYAMIHYGAKKADQSIQNMGYILHCFKCLHRETAKKIYPAENLGKCRECSSTLSVAGPLWLADMADESFCEFMEVEAKQRMFRLAQKEAKIISLVKNEAGAFVSYYVLDELCHALHSPVPPVKLVMQALKEAGFKAHSTHFDPRGIKSNASASEMKAILCRIVSTNRQILNNVTS